MQQNDAICLDEFKISFFFNFSKEWRTEDNEKKMRAGCEK